MAESRDWAVALISTYIFESARLAERVCRLYSQPTLLAGRQSGAIPRSGLLEGLEFDFHGIGCWISENGLSVDFDFLPDGRLGGFDAWRLQVFSQSNPRFGPPRSESEIQAALDAL